MNTTSIRIIGGINKSYRIVFKASPNLRPTSDRAKETLFSWLQFEIQNKACLDLFSGVGSFGIECLSQGASHVTFIEKYEAVLPILKKNNQIDNTLIIFTSDHGELLGDHGLIYKGCKFFEGLIHVPLIFSWPKKYQKNITSNALVESIDIAPTLLEACGLEIPYYMQGKSLHGLLTGDKDLNFHKEVVVTDFNDSLGSSEINNYTQATMTFDGRFKLAIYHSHSGLGELYDLEKDPGEFLNLWNDKSYKDLKNNLIARHLDVLMKTIPPGVERIAPA